MQILLLIKKFTTIPFLGFIETLYVGTQKRVWLINHGEGINIRSDAVKSPEQNPETDGRNESHRDKRQY